MGQVRDGVCDESVVNSQYRFDLFGHLRNLEALEVGCDLWELFHGLLGEFCEALTSTATGLAASMVLSRARVPSCEGPLMAVRELGGRVRVGQLVVLR